MKKIILAMAMTLLMSGTALAQQNDNKQMRRPDPAQMAQNMTERMVKRYGLDSKQEAKLLELNKEYAGKMPMMGRPRGGRPGMHGGRPGMGGKQPDMNGKQPDMNGKQPGTENHDSTMTPPQRPSKEEMDKRFKEMKADREAYNAKVKKIMTKKQYKKYTEDQEKMRPGHEK